MKRRDKKCRKMTAVFSCMLTVPLLAGCSLARADMQTDASQDRMIGALITDSPLDLFDMEGYIGSHISSLGDGDEVVMKDTGKYGGKLYATIKKNKSKDPSDWDISFKGAGGFKFLAPVWTDENGESYHASEYDDEINDVSTDVNVSETEETKTLSGTVYMLPNMIDGDVGYYVNPVYQTADGEIYAVEGGGSYSSGNTSEGEQFSVGLSSETTVTENGKEKTDKSSVNVKLAVMYEPVKIRIYQMDGKNQVVKEEEYQPGKMPEKIKTEKKAEYLLVETKQRDADGKTVMKREIYGKGQEEDLETYFPLENGILSTQYTEVKF